MSPLKKLLRTAEDSDPGVRELWALSLNLQMTSSPTDGASSSKRLMEEIDKQMGRSLKSSQAGAESDNE